MPENAQQQKRDGDPASRGQGRGHMPIASTCYDLAVGLIILALGVGLAAGILSGLLKLFRIIG
jgi:hypothetical protein